MPAHHSAQISVNGGTIEISSPGPGKTRMHLYVTTSARSQMVEVTASDVGRLIVHLHRILGTMAANPAVVIRKAHIREFPADYPEPEAKTP